MNSFLHLSAGFRTVPGNAVFALFRSPSAFCFSFYVNSLVNQLSVARVSQYKKKRSGGPFRSSGCVGVSRSVFGTVYQGRNMTRGGANLRNLLKINGSLFAAVVEYAERCVKKHDSLSVIRFAALSCLLFITCPVVSCFCYKTVRNVRKICNFIENSISIICGCLQFVNPLNQQKLHFFDDFFVIL